MATVDQATFIKDLVLQKFGVFADFKKWLATTGIVRTNGQIFSQGLNLKLIMNRITTSQASEIITALQALDDVKYKSTYDQAQIDDVNALIAEIEKEIGSWTFI